MEQATGRLSDHQLDVLKQMECEIYRRRKEMRVLRRLLMTVLLSATAAIALSILEAPYPQLKPFENTVIAALHLVGASVSICGIKYAKLISDVRLRKKLILLNIGCLLLNLGLAVMNFIGII